MRPDQPPNDEATLTLPLAAFEAFLSQLHDGPPQHAAALKVALAVWQGAVSPAPALP